MPRRLAAIMFTDISGFTALAQKDEHGALEMLQRQDRLLRPLLESHHGRKVKSMGDGLLIEFPDALDAVECGVELQHTLHDRSPQDGLQSLRLRVGIHLGDVQRQGTDILGDAVNVASRIEHMTEPEGLCLTSSVYDQVWNKLPYRFESIGQRPLKGVRQPVEVYRVVFPWTVPGLPVAAPLLPRIAVLPLGNISPDPGDAYFADGLTEELISVLSRNKGLRVISHTSVGQYQATKKTVAQIGAELGVDTVLEGTVRKAGDQLRVAVQLIDVRSDEHRWSEVYDRTLENVFSTQSDIAERTACALQAELTPGERQALDARPTPNIEAYESYLRGIEAVRRFDGSPGSDAEAVHHLEDALQKDPSFSEAYSHLADFLVHVNVITRPATSVFPRARALAARALELNPTSSDAHTARGNLAMQADQDWVLAEAELKQAIEMNPSDASARLWYGQLLYALQRGEEAKRQLRFAVELDPLALLPRLTLAEVLEREGDLKASITLLEKAIAGFGPLPPIRWNLAIAYALAGRTREAIQLVDSMANDPDALLQGMRASVLALAGNPDELRSLLRGIELLPPGRYIPLTVVAIGYVLVGENEGAIAVLQRGLETGDRDLWVSYHSPLFDPIRRDARFIELIRALKLPTEVPWPPFTLPGQKAD